LVDLLQVAAADETKTYCIEGQRGLDIYLLRNFIGIQVKIFKIFSLVSDSTWSAGGIYFAYEEETGLRYG